MAIYGVLLSSTNTGLDSELSCVFATPLSIVNNAPEAISETLNLKRVGSGQGVQRWEIQATIGSLEDATELFMTTILAGRSKKIYIRMPQLYRKINTPSGLNPVTSGNHGGGLTHINVSGFDAVRSGEFIQFANHSKVYAVVGIDQGVLEVYPGLTAYVPSGTAIKYGAKVTMHAKLNDDTVTGIKYENGILAEPGQYTFLEAL